MNAKTCSKALIWLILLSGSSLGCMYGPPFATVCEKFARADAIVIAKVLEVEDGGLGQKVRLEVIRSYKAKTQRKIVLDQPLSMCDWDFSDEVGKTYLLYLAKNNRGRTFHAIGTGYGGAVEMQNDDVEWLNGLPRSLTRTRISGSLQLYKDSPFEFMRNLSWLPIVIRGPSKTYELTTDKNGVFQLWDVPNGSYTIEPKIESNLELSFAMSRGEIEFKPVSDVRVDTDSFKVLIGKEKCGGSDYILKSKND